LQRFGAPVVSQQLSAVSSAVTETSRTEAIRFLTDLVNIGTSNPPGNERMAADYIKAVLDKVGIASEILESAPGRGNPVARLKRNGMKR
jgi:acetylornithine deacetylase/succinyl-diaminopimelate desuccinylase-like protein